MRLVVSNFYPVRDARRRYAEGTYPAQYLFGAVAAEEAGHEVRYAQPGRGRLTRILNRLTRELRWQVGDLASQISALRRTGDSTVFFGAAEETLAGLSLLRSVGLLPGRVAAVYHHPPRTSLLAPRVARGYDLVFTLSTKARDELIALGRSPERTILIKWGPQLDFAPYAEAQSAEYVFSCGKSARDIDTLAGAIAPAGVPGLIYARPGWARPGNGTIRVRDVPPMPPYPTVMREMARASVVTIPLRSTDRMYGLSELNDALGMGKPIVMTRTPHIDVDLDEIGCGHLVEPGDVEGWRSVLERLHGDPELRQAMGRRAREYAERDWNADLCARQVIDGLSSLQS